MKQWIRTLCAAAFLFAAGNAHADVDGAKTFVDTVAKQVLDILKTSEPAAQKQKQLVPIFSNKVDTNFVAKFVLGQNWRTATPQQQQEYLTAYGPFVINNYANKLTHYSGQQYTLTNARQDSDGSYLVTMHISGGDAGDANIDYRLRQGGGGYQLIDIVIEGVSLLTTQRSEFNGIVQNKGMDYLITQLKASTAKNSASASAQ
ncbi:MAG: ABC transporter substrate-binding protein [Alphaproteobacteria bacterium]